MVKEGKQEETVYVDDVVVDFTKLFRVKYSHCSISKYLITQENKKESEKGNVEGLTVDTKNILTISPAFEESMEIYVMAKTEGGHKIWKTLDITKQEPPPGTVIEKSFQKMAEEHLTNNAPFFEQPLP